ncbi:hypothetical protein K402DRAFT_393187 [Aulographum hederae CBS 113979]|uniref:Zn(2)-C6 fungal-type domain-containing protein n=1 Tax=Aulographum hederae CBS 113979 TaxID=1176131 RepID=A0A6G1H1V8_9PEZI|nr:hypothetical protein K402DRAFT_393187 [Aulographum hederae CBS 113979]
MPCSHCLRKARECRSSEHSDSCVECVRRGLTCDLVVSQSTWDRLDRESEALEVRIAEAERTIALEHAAEDAAREASEAALAAARAAEKDAQRARHRSASARAKFLRLQKISNLARRKEHRLFEKELRAIEDEEREEAEAEDRTRSAESSSVTVSSSVVVHEDVSFSQLVEGLSPSFWEVLDSGGEMPAPTAGSSQGS